MNDRDVDQLVRSALAAGAADAGSHPEPDTLFHYHAGELSAAAADSVQGHLAVCPACAGAVLDFETFPHFDAPSEDDVPTAEEIEAGWADVQARLGRPAAREAERAREGEAEDAEVATVASPPISTRPRGAVVVPLTPRGGGPAQPRRVAPVRRAPPWLQVAAALLLATTLGLGGYAFMLQHALDDMRHSFTEATAPGANVYTADLTSAVMRAAAEPEWKRVNVPPWATLIVLNLNPDPDPKKAFPQPCHVEIVSAAESQDRVWSGSSGVDDDGLTSVHWLRASAVAGRYRVLIRTAPGEPTLAEYKFELAYR